MDTSLQVIQVELKPDGANIPVTQKNKKEYIRYTLWIDRNALQVPSVYFSTYATNSFEHSIIWDFDIIIIVYFNF